MAAWVWYDQISIQLTANLFRVAFAAGGAAGVAKRQVGGEALGAETLFSDARIDVARVHS